MDLHVQFLCNPRLRRHWASEFAGKGGKGGKGTHPMCAAHLEMQGTSKRWWLNPHLMQRLAFGYVHHRRQCTLHVVS